MIERNVEQKNKRRERLIGGVLLLVMVIAALLRLFRITFHDAYTDEVLYAFRSIQVIDYVTAVYQTTPWQWFETVPWWAHLSFHDHPLGFFVLQHFSIQVFGQTLFAMRLPAVLAGLGSVVLVYMLAAKLSDRRAGLFAASLIAVQSYHLWISRIGIQDGVVIFFLLLTLLLWIQALETKRRWYWVGWGISLGCVVLTKYTGAIIVPILLAYAAVYKKAFYTDRWFWFGSAIVLVVISPVWLYNLFLYQAVGHFDFQISALLNQYAPEWTVRLGREQVGGAGDRFRLFFTALKQSSSIVFVALAGLSTTLALWRSRDKREQAIRFFLLAIGMVWAWFFVIGSTYRFVVMMVPLLTILIGISFQFAWERLRHGLVITLWAMVLMIEMVFSVNTFFLASPIGEKNATFAQIREENQYYGFRALDAYLDTQLGGRFSGVVGQPEYQFIGDLQTAAIARAKKDGYTPFSVMIIYDSDINFLARLWTLQRRLIYEGWPILSEDTFAQVTDGQYDAFFRLQGVERFIYIRAGNERVMKSPLEGRGGGGVVESLLKDRGIEPKNIYDDTGNIAFRIYEF